MDAMIKLGLSTDLNYEIADPGCDFIFKIHAARTASQAVSAERLELSQAIVPDVYTDPATHNRSLRLKAWAGHLNVRYSATVEVTHYFAQPDQIAEVPVTRLPTQVRSYIYPS